MGVAPRLPQTGNTPPSLPLPLALEVEECTLETKQHFFIRLLSDFGHIWVSLTLRVGLSAGPSLDTCSMLFELGRRQTQGLLLGVILLLPHIC